MKARTLLKKLTDYGLTVQVAGDKIRLSPRQLINDKVLSFVRIYKDNLLSALNDEQLELDAKCKSVIREGRLEIFRISLQRFLNDPNCRKMVNYRGSAVINGKAVEAYLDAELLNFDFDLETMIDMYREYTPKPKIIFWHCIRCGYRPPFCNCLHS